MRSVEVLDLGRRPEVAIRATLAGGEPVAITSYGCPTGVWLVPQRPTRWVAGAVLTALAQSNSASTDLARDPDGGLVDDEPRDPWNDR